MSSSGDGWGDAPPAATGDYGKASGPRASFGRRFVAGLIDAIVVGVVASVIGIAFSSISARYAVNGAIGLAYTTYLEGGPRGQSIGKRAMGIRVVDASTGGPIGYARGAVRYVVAIVSAFACLIGYLWMLWDGEHQTWHDKASTSFVVPVSAYPIA